MNLLYISTITQHQLIILHMVSKNHNTVLVFDSGIKITTVGIYYFSSIAVQKGIRSQYNSPKFFDSIPKRVKRT